MRIFLALVAVVGLFFSPVAAATAGLRCAAEHSAMSMNAPAAAHRADTRHDCCDDSGDATRHDGTACTQTCAAMCAISATLAVIEGARIPATSRALLTPAPVTQLHSLAQNGVKPPPRSFA